MKLTDLDNFIEHKYEKFYIETYSQLLEGNVHAFKLHYFLDVTKEYFDYFYDSEILDMPQNRITKEEVDKFVSMREDVEFSKTRLYGLEAHIIDVFVTELPFEDIEPLDNWIYELSFREDNELIRKIKKLYKKKEKI
jgi:hypothetical protein